MKMRVKKGDKGMRSVRMENDGQGSKSAVTSPVQDEDCCFVGSSSNTGNSVYNTNEDDAASISFDDAEGLDDSMLINTIEVSTQELVSMGCIKPEEIEFIYSPNIQLQAEPTDISDTEMMELSTMQGKKSMKLNASQSPTAEYQIDTTIAEEVIGNEDSPGEVSTVQHKNVNLGERKGLEEKNRTSQPTKLEESNIFHNESVFEHSHVTPLNTIDGKQLNLESGENGSINIVKVPKSKADRKKAKSKTATKQAKPKRQSKSGAVILSYSEDYEGMDDELPAIIEVASVASEVVAAALNNQHSEPKDDKNHPVQPATLNVEVAGGGSVQLQKYILQPGLCRVCLLAKDKLTPIFEDYNVDATHGTVENPRGSNAAHKFSILAALKTLLDVEVRYNDGLPDMICSECYDDIMNFSAYRKRIALGQNRLNEIIEKVKTSEMPTFIPAIGEENMLKTGVYKFPSLIASANELLVKSQYSHFVFRKVSDRVWDKIFASLSVLAGYKSEKLKDLEQYSCETPYVIGFFCETCKSTVHGTKSDFITHSYYFHGTIPEAVTFPCDICGNSFPMSETATSISYPQHWLQHFFLHECSFCSKKLPSTRALTAHKKYAHGKEKIFECSMEGCNKAFYQKPHLDAHQKIHLDSAQQKESLVPCNICGKLMISSSVKTHINSVHGGGKLWKCDVCQKEFKRKDLVISHKQTVHMGIKKYICDICGAAFKSSASKAGHIARHKGEKAYKCEICSQAFYTKNNLNAHKVKHQAGGFLCAECGKAFKRANDLEEHRKTHSGERPFECSICGSHIRHKSNYFKHMSKHKKNNELEKSSK